MIAAALDRVAQIQRTPFWALLVIYINMEPCRLPLDPSFVIFEVADADFRCAIGRKQRIALPVAGDGKGRRCFRRNAELVRTVAQPCNPDSRMNAIFGNCLG